MERLLCIKIASRGDLLLAAPAFRVLREKRRDAHITLLVGASCEDVARHLPFFDEIKVLDDRALMAGSGLEKIQAAWDLLKYLKESTFAEILIFHRDWRYGFLSWLGRVPVRKGFWSPKGCFFLTNPYRAGLKEHHMNQYLNMISLSAGENVKDPSLNGLWQFASGEKENALSKAKAIGFEPSQGNWIGLGFGGGRNVKTRTNLKTWPVEHYQKLASLLSGMGYQVVWLGDDEDAQLLGKPSVGINLSGKLSVPETAAVLASCKVAVVNDTLLLHLAESLGVSSIGLFGPTDPSHYRPLSSHSTYLWLGEQLECSPCHQDGYFPPCKFEHRCMTELSVESVLMKIKELR